MRYLRIDLIISLTFSLNSTRFLPATVRYSGIGFTALFTVTCD